MASHRKEGGGSSLLRTDRAQLSFVIIGPQCQEPIEGPWSAGAAGGSQSRGMFDGFGIRLRQHEALIKKPLSLIHTGPGQELRAAATTGKPTMTPDSESETGIDILRGGNPSQGVGATTGIVATVTPGGPGGTTSGAENVTPATDGGEAGPGAP